MNFELEIEKLELEEKIETKKTILKYVNEQITLVKQYVNESIKEIGAFEDNWDVETLEDSANKLLDYIELVVSLSHKIDRLEKDIEQLEDNLKDLE